jgi:protein-L-isoaspartate(D-aspartate) O-methyltransferase
MIVEQIERRNLRNPRVLKAMQRVPRHEFVIASARQHAYDDSPLPIGEGQTISQPYIVALMTSLLNLQGHETVLEIGTGSGYQAAILSELCAEVHSIERHANLAEEAAATLARLGYHNVHVHSADGSLGWPAAAPYYGILVTAAAGRPPQPLLEQLADNGRLIIPVGAKSGQTLQVWMRQGKEYDYESIIPVSFVPLRGEHGWDQADWDRSEDQY